ncbi:hypothetical protein [Pantoea sp. ME81]|uniref:hypothetical protein n=1 Tax=Pantoea sp. ME81 TaxID=2743935 RepID=UPI0015F48ACB|nr:hypothetical protein [Pantoea sp. ME81]
MTNKLTAEKCRNAIESIKLRQQSIREEIYLQALEIALPVLEAQEDAEKYGVGFVVCQSGQQPKRADPTKVTISFTDAGLGYAQPQPSTNPQIDNDGWLDWGGGERPVSDSTLVEVRLQRDGYQGEDNAMTWDWTWRDGVDPIIAYRVIENDGREG